MLKIGTLSGRYILVALLFVAILLMLGMSGHYFVVSTVDSQFVNLNQRADARQLIEENIASTRRLQIALQRYIILPDEATRKELNDIRLSAVRMVDLLSATPWVIKRPELQVSTRRLVEDMNTMLGGMTRVIEVRSNHRLWIPDMVTMEDELLPANRAFLDALELALVELEEDGDIAEGRGHSIYHAMLRIRDAWTVMISEFRLMVANRFGVFASNVQNAMAARAQNIELNARAVNDDLVMLVVTNKEGKLGLQASESLEIMQEAYYTWLKSYREVAVNLNTDAWRSDIPVLLNDVDPLVERIYAELFMLQNELAQSSTSDISVLTDLADVLRRFIWMLVMTGIALLVVGYLVYRRHLLAPIEQVSRAMKAHALGNEDIVIPEFPVQETRDLGDAFNEMCEHVNDRQVRLKAVLEAAAEAIITIDDKGLVQSFNRAAELMFGFDEEEMIGKNVSTLMPHEYASEHDSYLRRYHQTGQRNIIGKEREIVAMRQDGTTFPITLKVTETVIRGARLYTGIVTDITERKAMLEALAYRAERDPLTGLVNRALFQDRLEHAILQSHRTGETVALLFIDLDDFKSVNDKLGHQAGDKLLQEIAGCIQSSVRSSDTVARHGGDEFTVILEGIENTEHVSDIAEKVLLGCAQPFNLDGENYSISASIGYAFYPADATTSDGLIKCADEAMYQAKRAGKNQLQHYNKGEE